MTHLVEQAFKELYPGKEFVYVPKIKYSGQFKGYNANISLHPKTKQLTVRMSKNWLSVSSDIKKGLVQELLVRLFRQKAHTLSMDLYNHFMKRVGDFVPKTEQHPLLKESFDRVNEKYFGGILERPNLILGKGTTKLGHYDFGTDTIMISEVLIKDKRLLDYIMHHEMLHKKHQFSSSHGKHSYHGKEFRDAEKKFENAELLEKELGKLVRSAKRRKRWPGIF